MRRRKKRPARQISYLPSIIRRDGVQEELRGTPGLPTAERTHAQQMDSQQPFSNPSAQPAQLMELVCLRTSLDHHPNPARLQAIAKTKARFLLCKTFMQNQLALCSERTPELLKQSDHVTKAGCCQTQGISKSRFCPWAQAPAYRPFPATVPRPTALLALARMDWAYGDIGRDWDS